MDNSSIFEKMDINRLLVKLSLPIIFSMLVSELYNMIDTYFVGNYVDAYGIGALSIVYPIQRLIFALSTMVGIGTATASVRARGAGDYKKEDRLIRSGFGLVATTMVPFVIVVYSLRVTILELLGAKGNILVYAQEYLSIIILGALFFGLTVFMSNLMISIGKTKVSIGSMALGAIINLVVDYVLVKELGMGVKGAAIATALSQLASFILSLYFVNKIYKDMGVSISPILSRSLGIVILSVGVSAFIVEAEDGILLTVLNNLLQRYVGNEGIVILAAITKIYMFLFVTMFGISSGMQPIAAYNIGAKNYDKVREVLIKTITLALVSTGVLWGLSLVYTESLVSVFINDPSIVQRTIPAFRVVIAVFPGISLYYIAIFYFQAQGMARVSVLLSLLRQIVVMIPLSLILVTKMDMGATGVWISYPIADSVVTVVSGILLWQEINKMKKISGK